MDADREQSLLALLEWEERWDRWLAVPETDRACLVRELARLMIQMIDAGASDEHDEDHVSAS